QRAAVGLRERARAAPAAVPRAGALALAQPYRQARAGPRRIRGLGNRLSPRTRRLRDKRVYMTRFSRTLGAALRNRGNRLLVLAPDADQPDDGHSDQGSGDRFHRRDQMSLVATGDREAGDDESG